MMTTKKTDPRFAFFGTAPLAQASLDALAEAGMQPALIVAGEDSFDSRTKQPVFPEEKKWAIRHSISVVQPSSIDEAFIEVLKQNEWDVFIVASYGKILPKALLDIPKRGTINVHPSLLPRLRGPSPVRSAILNDEKETGVSIMVLDEKMDHGPLIAQKKVPIAEWPPRGSDLDTILAHAGGKLLATVLPEWIGKRIDAREQNHDVATYCKTFSKEDGQLDLRADAYQNLLKIKAFDGWPGTFAFFERGGKRIRVKILDAHMRGSTLVIDRVIPEGKKEMPYEAFSKSGAKPIYS